MSKILAEVQEGARFTYDGVEFVKLEGFGNVGAMVLSVGTVLPNTPFESEDAEREDHNNFMGSHIQSRLEAWLAEHGELNAAALPYGIDLTTMDGMTDYGIPQVRIGLLTIDEYRKYRRHIPLTDELYWLATGWTTNSSPYSYAYDAYRVRTGGTLSHGDVCYAGFAARPVLYLKSSILVSTEDSDDELTPEQKEMALYEGAVEKFGAKAQVIVAIEELSELQKALTKWLRHMDFGQGNELDVLSAIAEERADVGIMLNQLEVIFGDNTDEELSKLRHLEELVRGV